MKRNKPTYVVHSLFTEKFQVILYMESTPMFILFATVSSVASMVSGQNIVKLEMIQSINIVNWLIQVRVQTIINYYMI